MPACCPGTIGAGPGRGAARSRRWPPQTVEIAAALARHAVQGRDLRAVSSHGSSKPGLAAGPARRPRATGRGGDRGAAWAVRTEPGTACCSAPARRSPRRRRTTSTRQRRSRPAGTAGRRRIRPVGGARSAARRPGRPTLPPAGPADLVHLVAAIGMGVEEVGAEAFADAITASGLFPSYRRRNGGTR